MITLRVDNKLGRGKVRCFQTKFEQYLTFCLEGLFRKHVYNAIDTFF